MVHPETHITVSPRTGLAGSFLQSSEWEEFQKILGRRVWRVQNFLIIRHNLPFGLHYLYCPRPDLEENTEIFFKDAKLLGRQERSMFLKVDLEVPVFFPRFSFSACPLQPRQTILVDLSQNEEKILSSFHEKTRYNTRLAGRRGVQIKRTGISEFKKFWELLQETAGRDSFYTHPREYYEKLLSVRTTRFSNELYFAQCEGRILAAALVNFYAPTAKATYLHGASSRESRAVMAPHLLHWCIMKEAKKGGFLKYDLWGIDETRWPGVTRFKKGFGGEVANYPAGLEAAYRLGWYGLYRVAKKIKS